MWSSRSRCGRDRGIRVGQNSKEGGDRIKHSVDCSKISSCETRLLLRWDSRKLLHAAKSGPRESRFADSGGILEGEFPDSPRPRFHLSIVDITSDYFGIYPLRLLS